MASPLAPMPTFTNDAHSRPPASICSEPLLVQNEVPALSSSSLSLPQYQPAPAPPASPFSSAPSDIVSAISCIKASAAATADPPTSSTTCSAAPSGSPADMTVPVGATEAACLSFASLACSTSSLGGCMKSLKSECLNAVLDSATAERMLASSASVGAPASSSCPAHGVKAVCGKRNKMEDTFAVQPNFFDIPFSPTNEAGDKLPARIALQLEMEGASPPCSSLAYSPSGQTPSDGSDPTCYSCNSSEGGIGDTLHFFGVYDGHGGCQAAEHCASRLHHHLSETLRQFCNCPIVDSSAQLGAADGEDCESNAGWPSLPSAAARAVAVHGSSGHRLLTANGTALDSTDYQELIMKNSVDSGQSEDSDASDERDAVGLQGRDDAESATASSSSGSSDTAVNTTTLLENALKESFRLTDAEFANDGCAAMVGSTALVALVGSKKMYIANCGDSRAVLCRAGKAIQLTDDHKPEREDEAERVEKAGGQVLYWNGHRVMGVLAMSRAIGDHGLRPYIIAEPEVSVVSRTDYDEFLLLASDGLWDVMKNQEATNLTARCFKRARDKGASRSAAVRIAAAVLTKAAIDRGSKDNVTVVIVDVKPQGAGDVLSAIAQPCAAAPCTAKGLGAAKLRSQRYCGEAFGCCEEEPEQEESACRSAADPTVADAAGSQDSALPSAPATPQSAMASQAEGQPYPETSPPASACLAEQAACA